MRLGHILNENKRWVLITTTLSFLIICFILIWLASRATLFFSPFWVNNLGVSEKIGSNGEPVDFSNTFSSKSEYIYVFFELDSKIPVRLKIRWYYEDQLILENEDLFQPGWNYGWIASHNGYFKEGKYKVNVGGKTIEFKVEDMDGDNVAQLSFMPLNCASAIMKRSFSNPR